MKMNQEIKAAWTTALRSGNYRQGRRALKVIHTETGEIRHCCLGVLCEIVGKDAGYIEQITMNKNSFGYNSDYYRTVTFKNSKSSDQSWTSLPIGIASHCGLFDFWNREKLEQLTLMNDSRYGNTFAEIADYIDKEF